MVAADVAGSRKTRGTCDETVARTLRFAELSLTKESRRWQYRAVPRKQKKPSCEDCYFQKNLLCALELGEPCATFRPNRPEGLVPPKQPVLLMRPPRWASQTQAQTA
jgi:hypothetical protein